MMTREEILKERQELILSLKDADWQTFDQTKWNVRCSSMAQAISQLSSIDMLWLSEQYTKWFKESIKPFIPNLS